MNYQHKELAAGRWQTLSLAEQLGNIGSEVGRAARFQANNPESYESALVRARELLNLTIQDPRWRRRLKELTRFRELFNDTANGGVLYNTSFEDLDCYLFSFAVLARNSRANAGHHGIVSLAIIIALTTLAIIVVGGWYAKQNGFFLPPAPIQRQCTTEAMLCPDGSAVGRTGVNCEFAKCPAFPRACSPLEDRNCTKDIRYVCNPDGASQKQVPSSCTCGEDAKSLEALGWKDCAGLKTDTSTWKTYRNEKYGFEVKYPGEWSDPEISVWPVPGQTETIYGQTPVGSTFHVWIEGGDYGLSVQSATPNNNGGEFDPLGFVSSQTATEAAKVLREPGVSYNVTTGDGHSAFFLNIANEFIGCMDLTEERTVLYAVPYIFVDIPSYLNQPYRYYALSIDIDSPDSDDCSIERQRKNEAIELLRTIISTFKFI